MKAADQGFGLPRGLGERLKAHLDLLGLEELDSHLIYDSNDDPHRLLVATEAGLLDLTYSLEQAHRVWNLDGPLVPWPKLSIGASLAAQGLVDPMQGSGNVRWTMAIEGLGSERLDLTEPSRGSPFLGDFQKAVLAEATKQR
jgi:hypothetical protein